MADELEDLVHRALAAGIPVALNCDRHQPCGHYQLRHGTLWWSVVGGSIPPVRQLYERSTVLNIARHLTPTQQFELAARVAARD